MKGFVERRQIAKYITLLYLSGVSGFFPLPVRAADKGQPFDIQVTKFGTLDGGTNRLRVNEPQSGLIQTSFENRHGGFAPPKLFAGWVEKYHPYFLRLAARLSPSDVIELKGEWDKADRPLTAMGVPHTTLSVHKIEDLDLSNCKVLVVNCAGRIPKAAFQKVRDFVASGGALLTTDWALKNTIECCFPGYIRWNGGKTGCEVVDAYVGPLEPNLAFGVVSASGWKLDEDSQTIGVLNQDKVKVLAMSRKLARQDPGGQGILAVSFRFGKGKVLHMIGHFDNKPFFPIKNALPDPAPVIGISLRQALAGSFVLNALREAYQPVEAGR